MIVNDAVSRWQSRYSDPMGRWSTISMTGKQGRLVHFITVYQVVDKTTKGPFTVYQQQFASLALADRTIEPRKAFIMDLCNHMHTLQTATSEFVIMGDLNEVVGLISSGFIKVTNKFDLVDVMAHYHPIQNEVATYSRGSARLDYILCTSNLLSAVTHCGIEPFNEHIFSDHRSLFVDWDEARLFGSQAPK